VKLVAVGIFTYARVLPLESPCPLRNEMVSE
jgi:hypothetical protein